jgi:hypothetical protein
MDGLYTYTCHCTKYVAANPIKLEYVNAVKRNLKNLLPETILNKLDSLYDRNSQLSDTLVWNQRDVRQVEFLDRKQIDSLKRIFCSCNEIIDGRRVEISMNSINGVVDTVFHLPLSAYYNKGKREQYEKKIINKLDVRHLTPEIKYISYPLMLDNDNFILTISNRNVCTTYDGGVILLYTKKSNKWNRMTILQYGD